MRHNLAGSQWQGVNPENYRIKDDIEFYVDLSIYQIDPDSEEERKWKPFKSQDVQLRFMMLDPYYIINLS